MDDLISKLSEIRSDYNCFSEDEEPYYRALSEAIRILSQRADGDTISRQAALDIYDDYNAAVENGELEAYGKHRKRLLELSCSEIPNSSDSISRQEAIDCVTYDVEHTIERIKALSSAQPEQRWIPVSERLPEEDVEVLISYRDKDGDPNDIDIEITTYGQLYFGGNKVWNVKHWRPPFSYFESNYDVVAWKPLPEPYRGGGK